MGTFGAAHRWGRGGSKNPSLRKICNTYPTMKKLGTIIPHLKMQKTYESCDTLLKFFWHQHFFTGSQQLLLYQEKNEVAILRMQCCSLWPVILLCCRFCRKPLCSWRVWGGEGGGSGVVGTVSPHQWDPGAKP